MPNKTIYQKLFTAIVAVLLIAIVGCGILPSGPDKKGSVSPEPIDARGDLNANGTMFEIADAVMYTYFFLVGLDAFDDHIEASIIASDVNGDNIVLSVADLVYLIRMIQGDAIPYTHLQPGKLVSLTPRILNNEMIVDYETQFDIGAVWLQFLIDGEINGSLKRGDNLDGMDLDDNMIGDTLRVLISEFGPNAIPAGNGELLRIPFEGSLTLIDADAGDY